MSNSSTFASEEVMYSSIRKLKNKLLKEQKAIHSIKLIKNI